MNQTIGVNITPQSFQPTLHYSQGDVGRVFVINVTDYDIPTGATVTCVATKPSGMGFTVNGTVSGNTVTFTSTEEMTDEWGRFPAEIRIASGNTLLGTANFLMIGEKDPHPASTVDGTQEELIPQLTLLVNRVEAAAESVHDLTVSATTLAAGSDATATYDSTNNSIAFGIPRGADGDVTRSEFNDLKSEITDNGVVQGSQGLVSDSKISDSVPYLYRQTADGTRVGNVCYEEIVGGTVAWNQLMQNGNFESLSGWGADFATTSFADNVLTMAPSEADRINFSVRGMNLLQTGQVIGHKYLVTAEIKTSVACEIQLLMYNIGTYTTIPANVWTNKAHIYNLTSITQNYTARINAHKSDKFATSDVVQARNYQVFDLTQMFGTTIADYIYSLETATAGAGVAWFRALFPNDYYPYDAGTLKSVQTSGHKIVGFNQWDEEWESGDINIVNGAKRANSNRIRSKNFIRVLPNTIYYCNSASYDNMTICFYGDEQNWVSSIANEGYTAAINRTFTTPSWCHYIMLYCNGTTYKNDICINISSDRNGQYEPYVKRTYALDSTLTLRGVPKLSDGKIYFDGDTYDADGTVNRKYGIRAYQSGDESLADAITDGTNTVYKLTTPTTETAEPYTSPQIVDRLGTEEYVTTGIVPIGHNSKYSKDLKGKLEELPWNFSSLIAPTETAYKATRNYTSGSLLIVNNTLYKVTANIANGANITPNTNVTATTLAEVIANL